MAAPPRSRTRPLHNFSLPDLKWANQKHLTCQNPTQHTITYTDSGIQAVREKLMLDLKAQAETIKLSMITKNVTPIARPWNLRTRRSACKAPEPGCSPRKPDRLREKELVLGPVKFEVGLSRTEIEEDFKAMAGMRPPRRPKKRAKTVQRDLDQLFPGLWLTEITPETYKVEDVAE